MLACLVKITTVVEGSADKKTIYLTSANDRRVTTLGGTKWDPSISEAPAIGMQFWNGDFEQGAQAGQIQFTINLESARRSYPDILDAAWTGADVEVMAAAIGSAWPWKTRFKGKITTYSGNSWPVMSITAEVDLEPFSGNVLTDAYAGTGDAEGGADLKEQVKPLALGWPENVEPVLINEVDSVYQFSAYGRIENVVTLYERASAFPPADGNYATYAALVAADIEPGHWATCLDEGLIRLGAPAYGVITGDLKGHAVGGVAPRAVGDLIQIIADIAGVDVARLSIPNLDGLDAEGHTNSDIMITEQVTFIDAARMMILPMNRQVVVSNLGVFLAMKPVIAATPELTLHAQGKSRPLVAGNPSEQPTSIPYKTTTMAAERAWREQTFDEISTSATLVDRGTYDPDVVYREGNIVTTDGGFRWVYVNDVPFSGVTPGTDITVWEPLDGEMTYPDGTPISDLQPDEKGADVTSNVTGSQSVTVETDSDGVPLNGELPKTVNYRLFRGNANVTAGATWSVTTNSGTIGCSIGAGGVFIITSLTTETAQVRITALYGDKTRYLDVDVSKSRMKTLEQQQADLAADVAIAEAAATAAQAAAAQAASDAQAAQDAVQEAQQDIIDQGAIITAQGQAISAAQQDIIDNATSIQTVSSTVSSQGSAITNLQTAVTSNTGSIASLSTTVSSQGGLISANATAITTLQGTVSTLTTKVTASNGNLLANSLPDNGIAGWSGSSAVNAQSTSLGPYLRVTATTANVGIYSAQVPVTVGENYTASCDSQYLGSGAGNGTSSGGYFRLYLSWRNSSDSEISQTFGPLRAAHGFNNAVNRPANAVTGAAPSGASTVRMIVVATNAGTVGSSVIYADIRQVKIERGATWTPYTAEASVTQSFTAINTTNGQVSTLQSTVSTQGGQITTNATAISTLQGSVSSLSTTVTSQGASITALQTASSSQAGDIATLKTRVVAGGGNLLNNTEFASGLTNWSQSVSGQTGVSFSINGAGASFQVPGTNSATIQQTNTTSTGYADIYQDVPAEPGKLYEFSCWYGAHRCTVAFYLVAFDSAGANLGQIGSAGPLPQNLNNGKALSGWIRSSFKTSAAPSGTAYIRAYLRKFATNSGTTDSWGWFLRPQVIETWADAVSPQRYSTGLERASIEVQATAVSTLNTQYASLSTTVGTQGSSIATMQTAITTLNTDTATLKTQVNAGGGNLLSNTEFAGGLYGWTYPGGTLGSLTTYSRNGAGTDYTVPNTIAATMYYSGTDASGYSDLTQVIPITGGKYYDISVWYAAHRCNVQVYAQFKNSAGTVTSTPTSGPWGPVNGGTSLSGWNRIAFKVQADPTAVSVTIYLRKFGTLSGNSDSWAWFLKPQVSETLATSASPLAYSPGDARASTENIAIAVNTNTNSLASLSSTVSTQGVTISSQQTAITTINGNVTTLLGKAGVTIDVNGYVTGWSLNNNGNSGTMTIRSDRFRVLPPSGSGDGFYIDIDGSNRTTQYILAGSVRVVELGWLA